MKPRRSTLSRLVAIATNSLVAIVLLCIPLSAAWAGGKKLPKKEGKRPPMTFKFGRVTKTRP